MRQDSWKTQCSWRHYQLEKWVLNTQVCNDNMLRNNFWKALILAMGSKFGPNNLGAHFFNLMRTLRTLCFLNVASSHDSICFLTSLLLFSSYLLSSLSTTLLLPFLSSHLYLWILEKKAFSIGQPLSRDAKKLELILEQTKTTTTKNERQSSLWIGA